MTAKVIFGEGVVLLIFLTTAGSTNIQVPVIFVWQTESVETIIVRAWDVGAWCPFIIGTVSSVGIGVEHILNVPGPV